MYEEEKDDQMEVQATFTQPFTMIQNYIHDCMSFQQPIDKLIYMHLIRFAFHKGSAYPSVKKLCFMSGKVSPNTVKAALKRLEEMGLIKIEQRKNIDGTNKPNMYYINDLTDEMKKDNASDLETYWAAVAEDNERKRIKRKEKKKKQGDQILTGDKNDQPGDQEGGSNFDGPGKNNDGPPPIIDYEEESINKKHFKKTYLNNINQSIEKTYDLLNSMQDLPMNIRVVMKTNIDRLIKDNINPVSIETFYNSTEHFLSQFDFAMVLENVLKKTKKKIGNIHAVLKAACSNYTKEYTGMETRVIEDTEEDAYDPFYKIRQ